MNTSSTQIEWVALLELVRTSDEVFYRFTAYSPQLDSWVDSRRSKRPKKMLCKFATEHYDTYGQWPRVYFAAPSEFPRGKGRWAYDVARHTSETELYATLFHKLWSEMWEANGYANRIWSAIGTCERRDFEGVKFDTEIYTDASVSEDRHYVGISAVYDSGEIVTDSLTSRNQIPVSVCEAKAVLMALDSLDDRDPKNVRICSDSLSVVDSVARMQRQPRIAKKPSRFAYTIEDICDKIHSLELKGFCIDVTWVKGHAGLDLNEKADMHAKEAQKEVFVPSTIPSR